MNYWLALFEGMGVGAIGGFVHAWQRFKPYRKRATQVSKSIEGDSPEARLMRDAIRDQTQGSLIGAGVLFGLAGAICGGVIVGVVILLLWAFGQL